jgi:twitching motility protein PilT
MDLKQIIDYVAQNGISDLHLAVGSPIFVRKNGAMQAMGEPVPKEFIEASVAQMLTPHQMEVLKKERQVDFMFEQNGYRLRGNAFFDRHGLSACFRAIMPDIPPFSELGFPQFVEQKLVDSKDGLVLIVGPTGQGKSTTLASLLQARAIARPQHILTVEDPIEYIIKPNGSIVRQREIGRDVHTYDDGIMGSLREDPDVLMIGEIRDKSTMESTLTLAETGHMVLGTLHTNTAVQTINRFLDSFTIEQRPQVRSQLASNLSMIISQRLVPRATGEGRVLAFEILTMNYAIANYIRQDKIFQIPNVMQTDSSGQMVLFEQSLVGLVMSKQITQEVAYEYATDKNQLKALFELNNIA